MGPFAAMFAQGPWPVAAAAAAALVAIVAAAAAMRSMFSGRDEVVERLERTVGRTLPLTAERAPPPGAGWSRLLQPLAWLVRPTKGAELSRLRNRLHQGGYRNPHAIEIFLVAKVVLAVGFTVTFVQVNAHLTNNLKFPYDLAIAVWICGATFLAPNIWLASKIKERQGLIERSLPDAMDLMVTCVEAGLGMDSALARVSDEIGLASPLLGQEMNLTFLEIQAGVPRADSFRRLAERTGVEDLRSLSATLIQTEMFGTSVARALRVHAEGMRIKRMQRAEERAAMVGVKMTVPLILCILPSLVAVLLGPAVVSIVQTLFPAMQQ